MVALRRTRSIPRVSGNRSTNNAATSSGGGVFASTGCAVDLRPGAYVDDNEAQWGGGIGEAARGLPVHLWRLREQRDELRIAFDGDAVLFSDESEQVFQREGLAAFQASELAAAREPLRGGPFKPFLAALNRIQSEFPNGDCPIRTALFLFHLVPSPSWPYLLSPHAQRLPSFFTPRL